MWRHVVLVAVLASAACRFKSPRAEQEVRHAAQLEPAGIVPNPTEGGAIGVARVRVYADEEYQAQNPRHELKIRRMLERASRVMEPTVGLRFEVVEVRDWRRRGGDDLVAAGDELEALDPGEDVDLVIGMVSALSRVATQLHELGRARVLGRHIVLRGLNDAIEVAQLDKALGTLEKRDRQGLYSRRKQHKELVILLHELGHTLGGLHVTDERKILFWRYDHRQSDFGPQNARLMHAVAAARMAKGARDDVQLWRSVLDQLRRHPWEGWNEDEKAQLLVELESRARGEGDGDVKGEPLGEAVRAADRQRFRAAERLAAAAQPHDAWEELEPLIEYYPDEPSVHRLACRVAVAAERDRAAVQAICGHAAKIGPGDPEPHLRLAQWHLAAGDKAKSQAAALEALQLMERTGEAEKGSGADRIWADLARHFQALGAVTWAEKAAVRSSSGKEVTEWARATRVRFGMPPGGPVPPAREAEYVTGLSEVLKAVYGRHFDDAEKRAAQLQRSFGNAAGIHAARCDLEIRRHRYPVARAHCRNALRRYSDSAWAHYLTGLLDKRDRKPTAAIEHLERAITLDPDLKHAYQVAAELYDQLSRPADRKLLNAKYRAKFGHDL